MRLRFVILGVLLCLSTGAAIFAAVTTYHAIQQFKRERALAQSGDVSTIRPWMTVHFIAETYRVPENYLYQSLHIANPQPVRHATLRVLADHYKRPVNDVIHNIQVAILSYRRQHARSGSPSHAGQLNGAPRAPGRENQ
jgi:exonuclease V gamma subunit